MMMTLPDDFEAICKKAPPFRTNAARSANAGQRRGASSAPLGLTDHSQLDVLDERCNPVNLGERGLTKSARPDRLIHC